MVGSNICYTTYGRLKYLLHFLWWANIFATLPMVRLNICYTMYGGGDQIYVILAMMMSNICFTTHNGIKYMLHYLWWDQIFATLPI